MINNNFKKRLENLNDKQREAVEQIDGPVLVVAGPGTGKTELLSLRVGSILEKTDTAAANILLLTFTDSASENMRERLIKLIGETAYRVNIFTFHSFASFIISQYSEYFFNGAKFHPATPADQIFIMEEILENLKANDVLNTYHPAEGFIYAKDILSRIKDLKRGNLEPEDLEKKIKQNVKEYKQINNLLENFLEIEGKQTFENKFLHYIKLKESLEKITPNPSLTKEEQNSSVQAVLLKHLELAINEAGEMKKIGPLSAFKDEYLQKQVRGYVLKDSDENRI
jgi:DNA helicase-2/ATP-dependent DNA helicase PcrA